MHRTTKQRIEEKSQKTKNVSIYLIKERIKENEREEKEILPNLKSEFQGFI